MNEHNSRQGTLNSRRFTWTGSISLVQLIALLSLGFLVLSLLGLFLFTDVIKHKAINDLAREEAQQTSELIFQSLYSAMRKGWNKQEIKDVIERLNRAEPDMNIRVFRGAPVIRQFGEVEGEKAIRTADSAIGMALEQGEDRLIKEGDNIRYLYPVRVKQECRVCHTMASVGDINGVIDITYPVKNLKISMNYVITMVMIYFVALMVLLLIALVVKMRFFVIRPISHLVMVMNEIIQNTDLARRVSDKSHVREFNRLSAYFNRLLSTLQEYSSKLEEVSIRDPLTRLYNRRKFEEFLRYEFSRSIRHEHCFSLIIFDLDNFKAINDTYGHPVGDLVLEQFANLLRKHSRKSDLVARLGGDEFALILPETTNAMGIVVAEKLRTILGSTELVLPSGNTRVSISVGVASYPDNGEDMDNLFQAVDVALYRAKRQGKNRVIALDSSEQNLIMDAFSNVEHVRRALDEDRLEAYLQPIAALADGSVFGYEMLARIHDGDTVTPAAQFINAIEELGLAPDVDRRVFEKGLAIKQKTEMNGIRFFFNFSASSFASKDFVEKVLSKIDRAQVSASEIVFEITEHAALPNMDKIKSIIDDLRSRGIGIALDDFGSGFSSFFYLKYLNVDYLKLEGSFVRNITVDHKDRILVEHAHSMARAFGLKTIAEFVEDKQTHDLLRQMGIEYGQGYYYGRPALKD